MGTAIDTRDLDVGDLSLWADGPPHDVFEMLRREEPLHWSELNEFAHERGFWSVVRFDDIAAVGRDHETFSSKRSIILVDRIFADPDVPDPLDIAQHMMITQDPPRHHRMKALVQRAFTPKRALDHTERMREIINLVYDRALEGSDGQIDLVRDVGWFVPSMVIGDMLGAPREDAAKLVEWTNTTTAFQDPNLVPDLGMVMEALEEFMPYVDALIAEREQRPTDDLTSALIAAEIDGERMPREEILMFFFLLMVAGNDSTRSVFTSGMKSLMDDPEQMDLVRSGAVPLEQVVEEMVRMHPAFAYMRRTATRDTELHGTTVRAGDKLALWYVSGNRDETIFDNPHYFDVRREPNPHQGFSGGGRHFCLGAGLARLELKLWIEETLRRFPDLTLAGDCERVSSTFLNQYREMPVGVHG